MPVALWKERKLERLPFLVLVLVIGECGSELEEETERMERIERLEEGRRAF